MTTNNNSRLAGLRPSFPTQKTTALSATFAAPKRKPDIKDLTYVSNLGHANMRKVIFHPRAKENIREFSEETRFKLGKAIFFLQMGEKLTLPLSRPMSSVAPGVQELRIRSSDGSCRTFYVVKSEAEIIVFHAFMKKTQKTPKLEIVLARKRLKEVLYG